MAAFRPFVGPLCNGVLVFSIIHSKQGGLMQRQSGFTLIELMVTVAVVAILAAIALPSYTSYVTRSKLTEATTNLLTMRVKMEQYYQDKLTYTGACAAGTVAPLPAALKYFTITCPVLNATAYTIQADGGNGGEQTMAGISFTIDQTNARATTVTLGSPMSQAGYSGNAGCWVSKAGGIC
jgi:type IV pilus assembly protein PilE